MFRENVRKASVGGRPRRRSDITERLNINMIQARIIARGITTYRDAVRDARRHMADDSWLCQNRSKKPPLSGSFHSIVTWRYGALNDHGRLEMFENLYNNFERPCVHYILGNAWALFICFRLAVR